MDRIEQNFQVLLGCFQVTFGWVVHLASFFEVAPGLHPGLFTEIYLLRGFWRYQVMSYHFGKHLMRQTKS